MLPRNNEYVLNALFYIKEVSGANSKSKEKGSKNKKEEGGEDNRRGERKPKRERIRIIVSVRYGPVIRFAVINLRGGLWERV